MALPTTSLTMTAVGTALGNASRNLRVLCIDPNINEWSRYKPGYLKGDGTADNFVEWQPPRGGGFTDPRGVNPDTGNDLEGYRLGDYRGYNHTAFLPYLSEPPSTIEFSSGTSTSFGISLTFYAGEVRWVTDGGGVYREEPFWNGPITHVHALDASDDSFQGTALLPAIDGNVSIPLDGVAMSPGVPVTTTYHLAFGIDATHWHLKLGTRYGADGISDVTVLRLEAREILAANWTDAATTNITGGANDPYVDVLTPGGTTNYFTGSNVATWEFDAVNPSFDCYYSHSGTGTDPYTRMNADWLIKGFKDEPSAEYIVGTAQIFGNGAANSVTLPGGGLARSGGGDNSPNQFTDGDKISLIFKNITIVF